jgi:ribulose-5-phosphate 4-epimerase/fuculose-1-phosphate aldolase
MKVLFVGGTFDTNNGRESGLCDKIVSYLKREVFDVTSYNGGNYSKLEEIIQTAKDYDVVFWFANVPNNLPKVRDVKSVNHKVMLVTSKRNDGRYTFGQLINKALESKANLVFEFNRQSENIFSVRVFDPLGNVYYEGIDVFDCMFFALHRLEYLLSIKRIGSVKVGEACDVPNKEDFFAYIKECAEEFHKIINPDPVVTRFLGNSSFRCQRGFPSFKDDNQDIYVSRRDVDKRYIDKNAFVKVRMGDGVVEYWGDNKPSVDTPIQLALYAKFPKINFMIHTHCYTKKGMFTVCPIPCGAIEEVDEISHAILKYYDNDFNRDFYEINLKGHGCLIMASSVDQMKKVKFKSRPMPEKG